MEGIGGNADLGELGARGIVIDPPEGIFLILPLPTLEPAVTGDPPPTVRTGEREPVVLVVVLLGDPSPSESSGLAIYKPGATPRRRAPCGRREGAGVDGPA